MFRSFLREWVAGQKVGKEVGLDRGRSQVSVEATQPCPRLQSSAGRMALNMCEGTGSNYLTVISHWMGTAPRRLHDLVSSSLLLLAIPRN